MEAVHSGIKGDVIDGSTGNPVQNAAIRIRGNAKAIKSTRDGEYWRLLPPGEHVIFATANGYQDSQEMSVSVPNQETRYHKIVMQRR